MALINERKILFLCLYGFLCSGLDYIVAWERTEGIPTIPINLLKKRAKERFFDE